MFSLAQMPDRITNTKLSLELNREATQVNPAFWVGAFRRMCFVSIDTFHLCHLRLFC